MSQWRQVAVLGCALLLVATTAEAGYPTPAGGASKSGDPEVLLTFDDGPHEKHTAAILDVLEKRGLRAIFFWTGHRVTRKTRGLEKRRELVTRAVRSGHLIANHTINHVHLCRVDAEEAAHEIDENARLYEEMTGLPVSLLRVPYGDRCKRLDGMLAERGLSHIHWDVDPQEYLSHDAEEVFGYVTRKLRNLEDSERAVVLMHDTQPATVRALPRLLDWIDKENQKRRKRGRRPIRIIDGSQLVGERAPVPLVDWLHEVGATSLRELGASGAKLVPMRTALTAAARPQPLH